MTLTAGTKLGPYEILTHIGAGGMGEVYKARDTRLDRTVAIKVLPSHLADNPDLKQRFEREARAVSSLNHPHICTLYDVGEQDGTDFLVMEYIEGESLADRLRKSALPLDQALRYAVEIAGALDKAHRQGVVHRDLKPGNIMLTKSGAKLLDFGLAKFRTDVSAETSSMMSALPTEEKPLTEKGAILGTFQYMAPEQLEGKDADARTDIFAFGVVLYEMVTGNRAFAGNSQASLISAIIKDDPPALSTLQPMTPRVLELVVKKCLAKDPEDRWHSAHDLCEALGWVAEGAENEGTSVHPGTPRHRSIGIVLASLLVGSVLGAIAWSFLQEPAPRIQRVTRAAVPVAPEQLPVETPVLSPDGYKLVYAGGGRLNLRIMDELEAKPIPGTEGAGSPFFSPDGQWIGFEARGTLQKVFVGGGAPVTIASVRFVAGATWGADGTIVLGIVNSPLQRVSSDGSPVRALTTLDHDTSELSHRSPQFLPNGKSVLFTVGKNNGGSIAVASLETGEHRILFEGSSGLYLHTGHVVYFQSGDLMAVAFDPEKVETMGTPVPVVHGVAGFRWSGVLHPYYSVSETGTLVYRQGELAAFTQTHRLIWVDRHGQSEPFTNDASDYLYPRISPDGTKLAVSEETEVGRNIWLHDLERGTRTRLTFEGTQYVLTWTPDGRRIVFSNGLELNWKPAYDSGPTEPLATEQDSAAPSSWSPDGQTLLIVSGYQTQYDIWMISPGGMEAPRPFAVTSFNEKAPAFSPDGRFVAFVSDESGRDEVYAQLFPGTGPKRLVSTDGGDEPVWSRDGRELFYRQGNAMMAVGVEPETEIGFGTPIELFEDRYRPSPVGVRNFDVTPDAQRFIMVAPVESEDTMTASHFNIVLNWVEELKRLVPTKQY